MSTVFDEHLKEIAVELKSPVQVSETYNFEKVRDHVVRILKRSSIEFEQYFDSHFCFGTAAHGTRLYDNDEYDVLLGLKLPYYRKIELYANSDNYVLLDVSQIPTNLPMEDKKANINRIFLQQWLHEIFIKAFKNYDNYVVGYNNEFVHLSYELNDMLHTVYACSKYKNFEIDFVPAIKIVYEDHPNAESFYAVPKLMSDSNAKYSFMITNSTWEVQLLNKKHVLKPALVLLQALCLTKDVNEIYYYHLMHLALSDECYAYATNASLGETFIKLLYELCDAVENEFLPHFFESDINLFAKLSRDELDDYQSKLNSAYDTLSTYWHQENLSFERCCEHFITD